MLNVPVQPKTCVCACASVFLSINNYYLKLALIPFKTQLFTLLDILLLQFELKRSVHESNKQGNYNDLLNGKPKKESLPTNMKYSLFEAICLRNFFCQNICQTRQLFKTRLLSLLIFFGSNIILQLRLLQCDLAVGTGKDT